MSLFKSHGSSRRIQQTFDSLLFSQELVQDSSAFRLSTLNDGNTSSLLGFDGELACIAFDPVQSLLAVGTKSGRIRIYGNEKVPKCTWAIRPSQAVKHLVLKAGTSCVLVIDAKDTLHIFDLADLDERGEPNRLTAISMRSTVNCIEYIPQLSHVFLGCQDGSVDTYDVDRIHSSPYRIKNLWLDQDELLRRSGVLNAPSKKRIPACTDVKTHPLDPNQLLIAYEGGVALYDVTEQVALRTYEYLVLPGAPGGHNDQSEGAFLERRPSCTCLAWRPDGKVFCAGYDDGSIVFWSVEDGDRPIMARTIDMEDVNLATSSSLFGEGASAPSAAQEVFREPVFKLAWSGFPEAKAGTILSILGGLLPEDTKGLHCLHLPAYSGPSLLSGGTTAQARELLRASVKPNYKTVIPTDTAPEDFLPLTTNPHYGQTNDAYAVFMLLSPDRELPDIGPHAERGFAAFKFPPAPLRDVEEVGLPTEMQLVGSQSVLSASAVTLPSASYKRLLSESSHQEHIELTGGDVTFSQVPTKSTHKKHPTHHAVLTAHLDMSVRIWDYTHSTPELLQTFSVRDALTDDQLGAYLEGKVWIEKVSGAWDTTELAFGLSSGEVLLYKFAFARPDAVQQRQRHEEAQAQASEQLLQATEGGQGSQISSGQHLNPLDRIQSSRLDVEMAAAASSMKVSEEPEKRGLFGRRKAKAPRADTRSSQASSSRPFDVDLIDTSAYSDWAKDGYKPVLTLSLTPQMSKSSQVTALALSEAGFLAAAWEDKLAIVDLRGPEILFSEAERVDRDEVIVNLVWTVCAQGDDPERYGRLIVAYSSGLVRILTLSYVLDTWIVDAAVQAFQDRSFARPVAILLLDPYGNSLDMTTTALDDCLQREEKRSASQTSTSTYESGHLNTLMIVVSEGSLTVKANLTGDKLHKHEWGNGRAIAARIVKKFGMPVLVVQMADGSCVVFGLPKCEEIRTMKLSYERAKCSLSPDGRIFQTLSPTLFQYSTVFADQAPTPLKANYYNTERVLPPAPVASYMAATASAAASYVSSWFSGGGSSASKPANQSLDDLLAGPKRPAPRIKPAAVATPDSLSAAPASGPPGRPSRARPIASASPAGAAGAGAMQAKLPEVEEVTYNRFGMPIKKPPRDPRPGREMVDALEERGERLSFLNEQFDNVAKASQDFMAQTKRTAAIGGAKATVTGVGKGISAGIGKMLS